jgi:putative peptide zinc metalloprotease protein
VIGKTPETRILPFKKRSDLTVREQQFGNSRFWHIKDPVSLRYFQLKSEEYAVLSMLDGNVSLFDLRRKFEARFPPQRITLYQIESFLAALHGSGLIISEAGGQADVLFDRSERDRKSKFFRSLTNVLAIRFRGLDPTRLFDWLTPNIRFMFARPVVAACLTLIFAALVMAAIKFDTLQMRLPRFQEFFSASNLMLLAMTLGATKILHELAHAATCRHYGGECHEMGVMLLVFTPCLYCNVTDAWMLPNRWQRIAISAAGMYVELVLAAVSLFLWWWSVPGMFNAMCLNVVFICSVTTILFNGNPLLRYDGYYILADMTEIPNLRQQASAHVKNGLGRWFLGSEMANRRLLPEQSKTFLTLWYVAAMVYRIVVVWGILWFVHAILEPYGLGVIAGLVAVLTITSMVLAPLLRTQAALSNPLWNRNVNWNRLRIRSLLVLVSLVGVLMIPFPYSVKAPAIVQLKDAPRVFVTQPGRLEWAITPGAVVAKNDLVARLSNASLELEIQRLTSDVDLLKRQLINFHRLRIRNDDLAAMVKLTEDRKREKEAQLKEREEDQKKLKLRAPRAGTVFSPPETRPRADVAGAAELETAITTWSGTPLDKENLNATLKTGTEICRVGTAGEFEALIAIDENLIEFVRVGQTVELSIDHIAGRTITGKILDLAEIDLSVAPRELIEHDDFPTRLDDQGIPRPVTTAYQARVGFSGNDRELILGGGGIAKIAVPNQSLAGRSLRFLRQTFRLR